MFQHPKDVCMTYIKHFCFAMEMSCYLGVGCIKSIIHAFIPDIFINSTTETVNLIHKRLNQVGCQK